MRLSRRLTVIATVLATMLACDGDPEETDTDTDTPSPAGATLLHTVPLDFDAKEVAVQGDTAYLAKTDGIAAVGLEAGELGATWPSPSGDIDSVTTDGQWVYGASRDDMFRLDPGLSNATPIDIGLAWGLEPLVFNPVTATVFGRDRTDELLFEADFGNGVFVGSIDYTPDTEAGSTGSFASHMAVDGQTGVLYIVDAGGLYTVDPTGTSPTFGTVQTPESVESIAIDTGSRRLFVGLAIAGTDAAQLLAIDLDTGETTASVGLGNQIHHLATDPTTGRVFANVRVTTDWTTRLFALEGDDLTEVPWLLNVEADPTATSSSIHARLAIDAASRKLVVVSSGVADGGASRLEVYALPE